jgi:hypothetical protein
VAAPVLTVRMLNRALHARQLLLDRAPVPLAEALERIGGIQNQYAPSGYIGLWSRVADFRRDALTEELEARRVVQGTLMRSTIHLVSASDFRLFAAGTRDARRQWWLRSFRAQLDGIDMESATTRIRNLLAGQPRRAREMLEFLAAEGYPRIAWMSAGQWIDMVRVPPSGTWRQRRADPYGLADEWLGRPEVRVDDGLERLVRAYLGGFGPATASDIANRAGLPLEAVRSALDRIELARFEDENGGELLDLAGLPLPDPDTPAPVRFLPTWDATLLVHARRTRILPEEHRPLIFNTKTPHSVPTFLVDGHVAGSWRYETGRVVTQPFEPLSAAVRRAVEDEADRLAAFHDE